MTAFWKTVLRTFKSNISKFIAVTAIILLGICFVSGVGALSPRILQCYDGSLREQQVADIVIKSKSEQGFSVEQITTLAQVQSVEKCVMFTAIDTEVNAKLTRIYIMPIADMDFNRLSLISGEFPTLADGCVVERASSTVEEIGIGESVQFMGKDFTVSGIVANPLIFAKDGERDLVDSRPLETIIYVDSQNFDIPLPITDAYVKVSKAQTENIFSKQYKNIVNDCIDNIESTDGFGESCAYLTLDENLSASLLVNITDKVNVISLIFPIFFILVVGLVVLTTMTRLIEEERPALGCYKTLGYSDAKVAVKYVIFALLCCIAGMVIGNIAGVYLLPEVICPAFASLFFLPDLVKTADFTLGLSVSAIMLTAVVLVTIYVVLRELKAKPAMLLKPKSPKAGRKIFLESIPLIWNPLAFKYKSTFRNIFRYVGRFFMIVISVAGSTALVMAGFGLRDVANGGVEVAGFLSGMSDTISLIAYVVIIFAAALCVLVIYNLTNMNIGERRREIATLKVLGYHDIEVGGYIYREILIMAFIGIIVGIPLGVGVLAVVFSYLGFGSVAGVQWYSYILTACVNLVAIGCVDAMLYPKIIKEDMNTSLKAVE